MHHWTEINVPVIYSRSQRRSKTFLVVDYQADSLVEKHEKDPTDGSFSCTGHRGAPGFIRVYKTTVDSSSSDAAEENFNLFKEQVKEMAKNQQGFETTVEFSECKLTKSLVFKRDLNSMEGFDAVTGGQHRETFVIEIHDGMRGQYVSRVFGRFLEIDPQREVITDLVTKAAVIATQTCLENLDERYRVK